MVQAAIAFSQPGGPTPSSSSPGFALIGTTGLAVTASNGFDTVGPVVRWTWTIIDSPPGSDITFGVIQDGTTPTFTFTPDKTGGYHLLLQVQDSAGNIAQDKRVFQVRETSGRIVPPFSADSGAMNWVDTVLLGGAVNTQGWAHYQAQYDRAFDAANPWQTVLSVDFSAQPNQTLAPDGSYTVAGIAGVQKVNSANEASSMVITNGSGLRIRPGTTGTYGTGARTFPLIWFPFSAFMPATFSVGSSVRAVFGLAAESNLHNGACFHVGVDVNNGNNIDLAWDAFRSGSSGNTCVQPQILTNGSREDISVATIASGFSTLAATGTLAFFIPPGLSWGHTGHHLMIGYAAQSPTLPTFFDSIIIAATAGVGTGGAPATLTTPTNVYPSLSKLGLFIGAEDPGVGTYDVTLKNMRVEMRF